MKRVLVLSSALLSVSFFAVFVAGSIVINNQPAQAKHMCQCEGS